MDHMQGLHWLLEGIAIGFASAAMGYRSVVEDS